MSYFVIIRGPLGVGKTTIAKKLTKILNAKYYAVDEFLDKYNLVKEAEDGFVSEKSFLNANKIIIPKAIEKINKGVPVVFDGNFYRKSQIDDLISKLNFEYYIFTLKAPVEVCIERDIKRGETHGKDAAVVVHNKVSEFDLGTVINTENKTEDQVVREIISYLPKINN